MRKSYNISLNLLEAHVKSNLQMRAIALYYKIKIAYVNSRVYDYTPQKLSKIVGVSVYQLNKLVPIMIRMNLAAFENQYSKREKRAMNVLVVKSIQSIKDSYQEKIKNHVYIDTEASLKDIIYILKAECIKNYFRRQKFVVGCKSDLTKKSEPKTFIPKKRLKVLSQYGNDEEINNASFLSSRKAFNMFRIYPNEFKNFREYTAEKFGWLWGRRVEAEKCPYERYLYAPPKYKYAYSYWCKGYYVCEFPFAVNINR